MREVMILSMGHRQSANPNDISSDYGIEQLPTRPSSRILAPSAAHHDMSTTAPRSARPVTRSRSLWIHWNLTIWLLSLTTLAITAITYHQFKLDQRDSGSWGCEMSWMTPTYRSIDTSDGPMPRYKLWLYREAGWDDDQVSSNYAHALSRRR